MKTPKINIAIEGHYMISELTDILIAAGSKMNGPPLFEPLDHLMKIVVRYPYSEFTENSKKIVRGHAHHLKLVSLLVERLLRHGATLGWSVNC